MGMIVPFRTYHKHDTNHVQATSSLTSTDTRLYTSSLCKYYYLHF